MQVPTPHLTAAAELLVEGATKEVVAAFRDASVPHIVLKGPLLRRRLFPEGDAHVSADVDVLVAPDRWPDAEAVLRRLGFEPLLLDIIPGDRPNHARPHARAAGGPSVDLHRTLLGAETTPAAVWQVLQAETEQVLLGNAVVTVLNPAAQLLHVALHAAQNGAGNQRTVRYLERCLDASDDTVAAGAVRIASEIDASDALALGLSLVPAGRALNQKLGLLPGSSVTTALRATSAPNTAHALEWLVTRSSFRERCRFVLHKAFPPRAYMLSSYPGARTRTGLLLAYPARWLWLARQLRTSLRALRRARRASSRSHPVQRL